MISIIHYATSLERHGAANQKQFDYLFNSLFMPITTKNNIVVSLAVCEGIHLWPVVSPHKRPVVCKAPPCHDVIIIPANMSVDITWKFFAVFVISLVPVYHYWTTSCYNISIYWSLNINENWSQRFPMFGYGGSLTLLIFWQHDYWSKWLHYTVFSVM